MNPVNRRDVIRASSTCLALAAAACLDQSESSTEATDDTTTLPTETSHTTATGVTDHTTTETRRQTEEQTETQSIDEQVPTTEADGDPESSRAPPGSYPDYGRDVTTTIGYDAVDPTTAAIYLEPSTRTVSYGESISFTLANNRAEDLRINFYAWQVHKYVDGEWFHVAPQTVVQPLMTISAGEAHTWTLTPTIAGTEAGEPVSNTEGTADLTLPALGGGVYAFGIGGWFASTDHSSKTAFSATFALDADPLQLTPTNAITQTEWEGETLVAQSDRGKPDDPDYRLGAYELERLSSAPKPPQHLITEQVVRERYLRDAIALAQEYDADHVRLEEYNGWYPIFGVHGQEYYQYEESYYRVTARTLEQ